MMNLQFIEKSKNGINKTIQFKGFEDFIFLDEEKYDIFYTFSQIRIKLKRTLHFSNEIFVWFTIMKSNKSLIFKVIDVVIKSGEEWSNY